MRTASSITPSRFCIAAMRPVGVLGRSFGQAVLSTSSALPVADPEIFERRALGVGRLDGLRDLLDRPVGQAGGGLALADVGTRTHDGAVAVRRRHDTSGAGSPPVTRTGALPKA